MTSLRNEKSTSTVYWKLILNNTLYTAVYIRSGDSDVFVIMFRILHQRFQFERLDFETVTSVDEPFESFAIVLGHVSVTAAVPSHVQP